MSRPVRRLAALFALGAVLLSTFDGFHTHSGTTRYAKPWFAEMAWWTPLLFGTTLAGLGWAYDMAFRARRPDAPLPPARSLATALVGYAALYAASGYWGASSPSKLGLLVVSAGVFWRWLDGSALGVALGLATALIGTLAEISLITWGAFEYLRPDFFGVPIWLPGLYLAGAPVLGQIARRILAGETGFQT